MAMTKAEMAAKNNMELVPQLREVLESTYGIIVYQEQVMKLFQIMGKYTLGGADNIRRAMSKKKEAEIQKAREQFVDGSVEQGIDADIANYIYDKINAFASYAFNKAHAAAYAKTALIDGTMKYYFPAEHAAAYANWDEKVDELHLTLEDARANGVTILPPNINFSREKCYGKNKELRIGLSSIKGVGSAAKKVVDNAPYSDIADFILRGCENTRAFESMAKAGAFDNAFDGANFSRKTYLTAPEVDKIFSAAKKIREKQSFIKGAVAVHEILLKEEFVDGDEFRDAIKDISFTYTAKKAPTADSVLVRINNAKTAIEQQQEVIKTLVDDIQNIPDDRKEALINEYEVIGVFVSGDLLDEFETPDGVTRIGEIADEGFDTVISGVVLESEPRYGLDFVCQDKTGQIRCHIFQNALDKMNIDIEDFGAYVFEGQIKIDDYRSTDDNIVYQMVVSKAVPLANKMLFEYEFEGANFNEAYNNIKRFVVKEGEIGYPCRITSLTQGVTRELRYRVSEDIKNVPGVRVLKVLG